MGRLEGRAVLVTGASSGIGRAVARRCADEGASVLATGRDEARLAELSGEHEAIATHAADLGATGSANACVRLAVSLFGRLDGVVHAAGIVRRSEDIRETADDEWSMMRDVNLDATFRIARACLRQMVPQGSGSIVLVSSQLAHVAAPGYVSYCTAKGGVEALVRALAVDFGPAGIRVNALAPGFFLTEQNRYLLTEARTGEWTPRGQAILAHTPAGRLGEPQDLIGTLLWLVSPASSFVTGVVVPVDGGFSAYSGV